jgi:hypothetical protein
VSVGSETTVTESHTTAARRAIIKSVDVFARCPVRPWRSAAEASTQLHGPSCPSLTSLHCRGVPYPRVTFEQECDAVVSRCDLYSGMTDERAPHKRRYLCAACCICLLQGGGLRIETGAARSAAPTCRLDGCSSVVHGHMSMGRFDVRRVATRKWYTWWQPGTRSSRAAPRRAAPYTHGRTVDLLPLRRAAAYWKRVATWRIST